MKMRALLLFLLLPLLAACQQEATPVLEQILEQGELRVVTRNTATTYQLGANGPTGLEYDLAKGFAESLGVELKLIVAANVSEVVANITEGKAHFAAAGLTVTEARQEWARFTPPYQEITQQLVYRVGTPRPADLSALSGQLEVLPDSSHVARLQALQETHPELTWVENPTAESETLLARVAEGAIDYTVADSNEVILNQRFYPDLRVAFDLTDPEPLAWAFPKGLDDSLYTAAVAWFDTIRDDGQLAQKIERHYGHVTAFDHAGARYFRRHVEGRLPKYLPYFQKAADANGLDWRLLAAMAYQESHWNPRAVSPTGVRGMMMLTQVTARQLGVSQRTDTWQSIEGGARYIRSLMDRVPERIPAPDRIWFAIAAYNIGYGHMEDARRLTQRRGGDPDRWMDVKETLPLLREAQWYRQTRFGYARGHEAYTYVENIRGFYDILVWLTEERTPGATAVELPFIQEPPRVSPALLRASPAI